MKLLCLSILCLSCYFVNAVTVELSMTNSCAFAEKERNTHISLTQQWNNSDLRLFTLSLTARADTNTAFSATFGADSVITNSFLESSETSVVFGWNAGVWEIRPEGLRSRFFAAPASTDAEEKTLFVRMRVTAAGDVSELEFRDGGPSGPELTFTGLDLSGGIPGYFNPADWNILRWTTRGFDDDAQATAEFHGYGATLILR